MKINMQLAVTGAAVMGMASRLSATVLGKVLILSFLLLLPGSIFAEAVDFPLEPLVRETPLVVEGKALGAIVYPAKDTALKGLSEKIAGKIKGATGVDYPAIPDLEIVPKWCGPIAEKFKRQPLIILGDINRNRAVFPLYAKYLCWCDANYPGEGGYDLRTVVSPYYYRSPNQLVIAAGGEKEYLIAVDEFIKKIETAGKVGSLVLPGFLDVKLGAKWKGEVNEAKNVAATKNLKLGAHDNYSKSLCRIAKLYQLTGEAACAEAVRQAFLRELAGNSGGIAAGTDYSLEALARSWELTRDSGVYTPEEIRNLNQALFMGMDKLKDSGWCWKNGPPENALGDRHSAAGTFAFMVMGQALRRNCPDDTATARQLDAWISGCKKYFDAFPERGNWRGPLDNNESTQVTGIVLTYAFREGNLAIFETGLAREAARQAMSLVDSKGFRAGHGFYEDAGPGALRSTQAVGELLSLAGFYYRDPQVKWMTENFPGCKFETWFAHGYGLEHAFAMDSSVSSNKSEDGDLIGVVRSAPQRDQYSEVRKNKQTDIPFEEAFDKLALRDGLNPTDKYLVLQGIETLGRPLGDVNSILRMMDQGMICLFHNNKWSSKFHRNGVLVSSGFGKLPPRAARFDSSAEFKGGDFIKTSLPDYNGTTWSRSIFSLKNSITVVFDDVKADRPGDYSAICTWRTPYASHLDGADWMSSCNGVEFHILNSAALRADAVIEPMLPGEIGLRGTGLRQIQYKKLAQGEKISFRNLLYTNGELRPACYEIRQLSENCIIVKGKDGRYWLIGMEGFKAGGIATDAAMFIIGGDKAFLGKATFLKVKDKEVWKASSPENKEINASPELAGIPYGDLWAKGYNPDLNPAPLMLEKSFWSFIWPEKEALRHLWSYKGFHGQLMPIPGISAVNADSGEKERLNQLFNEQKYSLLPNTREGLVELKKGQEIVIDLHDKFDIKGLRVWGDAFLFRWLAAYGCGYDPKIWPPPLRSPVEVEIAVNGIPDFTDVKPLTVELGPHWAFREIFKSETAVCAFNETEQLKLHGRYLRVRFPKENKSLLSPEIEILGSQVLPPEFIAAVGVKRSKGAALAVATGSGEIALLSTEGRLLSSKILLGVEPLHIAASDMDGDGADDIIVSGSDGGIHVFGNDNKDEWIPPAPLPVNSLAYTVVPGDWIKSGNRPLYSISYYDVTKREKDGGVWTSKVCNLMSSCKISTMWAYDLLPPYENPDQHGKKHLIGRDIFGSIALLDTEGLSIGDCYFAKTGEGRLMYWTYANLPDGKGQGLLLVSSKGFGLHKIAPEGKFSTIWSHSDDARQFCGLLADVPGKGQRILIGRADGFIAEFDMDGNLIANHWAGWPVKALESAQNSDGKSFVFAGTDGGIVCFDKDWKAVQFIPGACVKLLKIRSGETNLVFSFSDRGVLDCYSCE